MGIMEPLCQPNHQMQEIPGTVVSESEGQTARASFFHDGRCFEASCVT